MSDRTGEEGTIDGLVQNARRSKVENGVLSPILLYHMLLRDGYAQQEALKIREAMLKDMDFISNRVDYDAFFRKNGNEIYNHEFLDHGNTGQFCMICRTFERSSHKQRDDIATYYGSPPVILETVEYTWTDRSSRCMICYQDVEPENLVSKIQGTDESHSICRGCFASYLEVDILDGKVLRASLLLNASR
jgi:hypothetical protein